LRGVPLTVVHVLRSADINSWVDVPVPEEYLAERDRRAAQVIAEALRVVADAISDAHGIVVDHRIVPGPNVAALVDMSKDAEMIVVGSRPTSMPWSFSGSMGRRPRNWRPRSLSTRRRGAGLNWSLSTRG
jgi:nucleotide-binding universal stress UspA family protein